jgi:hypothetical protein
MNTKIVITICFFTGIVLLLITGCKKNSPIDENTPLEIVTDIDGMYIQPY